MKSTPSTFREKIIKKIPLSVRRMEMKNGLPEVNLDTPMPEVRPPKVEKMKSFIPMPQTMKCEEILRMEELEKKIQELSDRILELEHTVIDFHREFVHHTRDYDHRLLDNYEHR